MPTEDSLAWIRFREIFYRFLRMTSRIVTTLLFHLRVDGRHHLRHDGGAMLLSMHQSSMDPVLVGLMDNHFVSYLARHTLFKHPLFAFLIRLLNAIEIDRERGGLAGLREMLKRLKNGERVLLFPEGTRTDDGQLSPLKPGFIPIARRSQVPLIPIAIAGAYECMPKGQRGIRMLPIALCVGKPISAAEYLTMTDDELLATLTERFNILFARAQALQCD